MARPIKQWIEILSDPKFVSPIDAAKRMLSEIYNYNVRSNSLVSASEDQQEMANAIRAFAKLHGSIDFDTYIS